MNRENDVSAVLQQYTAETGVRSVQKVEQDFVAVVQQVPAEEVTTGLAQAMHSEHTPPFEDMVGESFERGDETQRAGLLRQLLDAAPTAVRPLVESGIVAAGAASSAPAALVDGAIAQRLDPELVRQMAREAVQEDPAVIDRMSAFYAIDPAAGKTLGGAALSVALGKIAERR
ncbi:MAG TPA: hypothetical protein VEC01_08460 [Noviherbaspirillum sp.]|uniref:hypothetical protein n=1 Tax=Noviherbaspirillum sp. TaxID=1926288 RepID=UPI002D32024A|nr:hypothetical protein [Noviherbaspirillum sp.]HYD95344.1 hypothetical protein [Noviherbaspirillum sp.]